MKGGQVNRVRTVPQLSHAVSVVSDDHPIAADLSVPVLFGEGEAEIPGAVLVGGGVLPGSGGADHVVAGHLVSFELRSVYRVGGVNRGR